MNQLIATIVCVAGIIGLFILDRDATEKTSNALWIPTLWLMILGSRPVSTWFQATPELTQASLGTEGSPIDAFVYGALIAASSVVLKNRSGKIAKYLSANLPLVLFFSYCALSLTWSDYPFVSLKRWVKAAGDFSMVLVVLTDSNPLAATKRLFSRVAFVLLPLSILFIKNYPEIGRTYNQWTWTPMYNGVTLFKNLLGMTCLVCGLGSLWQLIGAFRQYTTTHRVRHLLAHGMVLASAVWLIYVADSMTSMTCLVIGGAVMVMTTWRWVAKQRYAVHAIIGSLVALSVCALFIDTGGSLIESLGRDTSLTGRTGIWKAVLSVHSDPIFGAGFESFWTGSRLNKIWDMTAVGIQEAHNGYLEVYLNIGWVGVLFLAGVIISGYRYAVAVFRSDPYAGMLRLGIITAGVIYSISEAGFRMMSPIWIVLLLAVTRDPVGIQRKECQRVLRPVKHKSYFQKRSRLLIWKLR